MKTNRCFHVTLIVFALAFQTATSADVPRLIHYQGKLRDAGGAPVSGSVNLSFQFYPHATESGSILYEESHADVPVANGLFNVLIGSQTLGGVPDSALDAAEVFLGIAINFGDELAPRPRIGSSPHAIKSESAEQLVIPDSFTPAATVDATGNVGIGTPTPAAKLDVDGDGSTVLVPRKTNSGDPTGLDGMIYYNAAEGKFRGHEDGSWADMRDGSGSASDPCNCPLSAWSLIGVINTTVGFSGGLVAGEIDVSDNQREYLLMYHAIGGSVEIDAAPDAETVIYLSGNLNTTAGTYKTAILDSTGVFRTGSLTSATNQVIISSGADWSNAGAPTLIFNIGDAYVFSNGAVRLNDGSGTTDYILWVMARTP